MMTADGPVSFFNRELSWLAFNERVLEEASDGSNPLLERLKFATIVASNLDEFFMVRVAGLQNAVDEGAPTPDPSGMMPTAQLGAISERAHAVMSALEELISGVLLPELAAHGIHLTTLSALDDASKDAVRAYFRDEVQPVLTPLAIDLSGRFPMLSSLSVNLAFVLAPQGVDTERRLAVVQIPPKVPRLIRISGISSPTFVLLDDLIRAESEALFPGQALLESAAFRLTRDSELELDDEGGQSYLEALEQGLRRRRRSAVVRLEIENNSTSELAEWLARLVSVEAEDVYRVRPPIDIRVLAALVELPGFAELRDRPLPPVPVLRDDEEAEIFSVLDERDLVLHHPYDSFDPTVSLLDAAADDPDVLAIKQTLYRTSGDSPIVAALTRAADQGKQVTVVVELMARFDESRNIQWARRLEDVGAHVIYGVRGYKVHAKICLVVKRTPAGLRRYVHLGTGNYNDRTARAYTDFGLMTSSADFGADASAFFSAITGYSDPPHFRKLTMAPTSLRDRLLKLIEREGRRAQAGQPAAIRAKMNSLLDPAIVEALYRASRLGVRIALNVRGICTLRPGVKNMSENISVVSIVGRFLEHARIFAFHNGGDEEVYLSSADWMTRNLDRRVELMFPVEAPAGRRKVLDALDAMFRDNVKARRLAASGDWKRPRRASGVERFDAQLYLYELAQRNQPDSGRALLEPLANPDLRTLTPAQRAGGSRGSSTPHG
jgi:polyphosphate kinase